MIRILKGSGGYDVVYRIDGNRVLKSDGYDVVCRLDRDSDSPPSPLNNSGENPGCLGKIIGVIVWAVFTFVKRLVKSLVTRIIQTWSGRIGAISGAVIGIIYGIFMRYGAIATILVAATFVLMFGSIGVITETKSGRIGSIVSGAFVLAILIIYLVPGPGGSVKTWVEIIPFWIILTIICGLIGKGIGAIIRKIKRR
jgi:hypothetical protein